ncbi:hypothetical protein [Streptomyces noursei]|uniref:hypothetical protein n=1 Tax=Streptomyces noursei TaxID=1971 RepID=UPI0011AF060E|nr:hypothetical protein [Streptomyces noursei]
MFDGVFLGERDGEWIAGRQFPTQSRYADGFSDNGDWRYATYYDSPSQQEAYRAWRALREYVSLSKNAANCWDPLFIHAAGQAIDRYWAHRVPLNGVADMSAAWVVPGLTGDANGSTDLLPAAEAKYWLLQYLRGSCEVGDSFRRPQLRKIGSALHKAYQAVIEAAGPLNVSVSDDRFSLSFDGSYNYRDDRWRRVARNPHPDRKPGLRGN